MIPYDKIKTDEKLSNARHFVGDLQRALFFLVRLNNVYFKLKDPLTQLNTFSKEYVRVDELVAIIFKNINIRSVYYNSHNYL